MAESRDARISFHPGYLLVPDVVPVVALDCADSQAVMANSMVDPEVCSLGGLFDLGPFDWLVSIEVLQ